MTTATPTSAILPIQWTAFDWRKGRRQQLPLERKWVLVAVQSTVGGLPAGAGAGYLKYAAGDPDSPKFIMPGIYPAHGVVIAWADCLPIEFAVPTADAAECYFSACSFLLMLHDYSERRIECERETIEDYRRQGYTVEKTVAAITINALHNGTYGSRAR